MKTYSISILGCKVNDYEANSLIEKLDKEHTKVPFGQEADITVIFTCCVTNTAESKTRKMIHKAKKVSPNGFLVVVGCLVQIKKEDIDTTDIDLLVGSTKKDQLFDLIINRTTGVIVEDLKQAKFEYLELTKPQKTRAFLKVQDGCNQFCSYCIIPYARGRERSGDFDKLVSQAAVLAQETKEIVLTGIHTGRYFSNGKNLCDLVHAVSLNENIVNIRLSSIEINEVTNDLISEIKNNPKIGKNLHISVQSLDNEILKLMNRPYTYEYFLERINYIREQIPDISISTDIIVGFPNETNEIFEEIKQKLNEIRFAFIHVFPFAKKVGTKAYNYEDNVSKQIKKERVNTLINQQISITNSYLNTFINKETIVLIEEYDGEYSYGYSKYYFKCKIKAKLNIGYVYSVIIKEIEDEVVICECST